MKRRLNVYDAFGCALDGNVKRLCKYTAVGLNLNQLHPVTGNTLLHTAILGKHDEAVTMLLHAGANPNVKNEDGETPLIAAVRAGMQRTVWSLIRGGADVNLPGMEDMRTLVEEDLDAEAADVEGIEESNEDGNSSVSDEAGGDEQTTPLMSAVEVADEAMVQILVSTPGLDVNQRVGRHQKTALHEAAFTGNVRIVELLLTCDAAIDAVDLDGATPLCYAALENNVDVIKLLLTRGAALHGSGAWAPLHAAATRNQLGALSMLLHAGHDVNAVDDMGMNALTLAAAAIDHSSTVIALLEWGALPQLDKAHCWHPHQAHMIRSFVRKTLVSA